MTGRHPIRSGTHTVALGGEEGGLIAWERTIGDILSDAGYATCCVGKWHIGAEDGRWPTDHGFDEWYGIPRSYDECLWPEDPRYDPKRDPVVYTVEGTKATGTHERQDEQLTLERRRNIDLEQQIGAAAQIKTERHLLSRVTGQIGELRRRQQVQRAEQQAEQAHPTDQQNLPIGEIQHA